MRHSCQSRGPRQPCIAFVAIFLQVYAITPDRGPTTGGTRVTLSGANLTSVGTLGGGVHGSLLCRFGGSDGVEVEAFAMTGSDAVQCDAPANPRDDKGTEVRGASSGG